MKPTDTPPAPVTPTNVWLNALGPTFSSDNTALLQAGIARGRLAQEETARNAVLARAREAEENNARFRPRPPTAEEKAFLAASADYARKAVYAATGYSRKEPDGPVTLPDVPGDA